MRREVGGSADAVHRRAAVVDDPPGRPGGWLEIAVQVVEPDHAYLDRLGAGWSRVVLSAGFGGGHAEGADEESAEADGGHAAQQGRNRHRWAFRGRSSPCRRFHSRAAAEKTLWELFVPGWKSVTQVAHRP